MTLSPGIRCEKRPPIKCKGHRDFVADQGCCIPGCYGVPVVAHHLKVDGLKHGAGKGLKPCDSRTVNICSAHHLVLHDMPEALFWFERGIEDPGDIAAALVESSPYRHKFRRT